MHVRACAFVCALVAAIREAPIKVAIMGCSESKAARNARIEKEIRNDLAKRNEEIKLLLLGPGESGAFVCVCVRCGCVCVFVCVAVRVRVRERLGGPSARGFSRFALASTTERIETSMREPTTRLAHSLARIDVPLLASFELSRVSLRVCETTTVR